MFGEYVICAATKLPVSPSRFICFMMLLNVWVMGFIAWRKKRAENKQERSTGYIQLIAAYLPTRLKIWFIVSMLLGALTATILSLWQ